MSRKYTLQVEFDGEYELRRAVAALELLVPPEGENNVMTALDVKDALIGLHDACFSDKRGSRPAIMPAHLSSCDSGELESWQGIAADLVRYGMYLQRYIDSELEQEEPTP